METNSGSCQKYQRLGNICTVYWYIAKLGVWKPSRYNWQDELLTTLLIFEFFGSFMSTLWSMYLMGNRPRNFKYISLLNLCISKGISDIVSVWYTIGRQTYLRLILAVTLSDMKDIQPSIPRDPLRVFYSSPKETYHVGISTGVR